MWQHNKEASSDRHWRKQIAGERVNESQVTPQWAEVSPVERWPKQIDVATAKHHGGFRTHPWMFIYTRGPFSGDDRQLITNVKCREDRVQMWGKRINRGRIGWVFRRLIESARWSWENGKERSYLIPSNPECCRHLLDILECRIRASRNYVFYRSDVSRLLTGWVETVDQIFRRVNDWRLMKAKRKRRQRV